MGKSKKGETIMRERKQQREDIQQKRNRGKITRNIKE